MKFQFFKATRNAEIWQLSIEECKRQYRKLAMRHHPDRGGRLEDMQQVNAEWDYLRKHNYNIHETKDGNTYTDQTQDAPDEVTNRFVEIIEKLINLEGLEIEICGSFLWVGGNTYEHRAAIKELGFRWANKKKMWYMAPEGWRKKGRRELTINEIRDAYGSQKINSKQRMALTA